jgi:tetratricopeptide (TPR) repeat protein/tRNA A-37 threonylcarbamoyl transferase component Bud32
MDPDSSPPSDAETRLVGETIGRYRLERVLFSGGMGTVFVARQERPRREVAIKILREGIASHEALRRFEIESQILAGLRHPGIAQVFEAGTWSPTEGAVGVPYFAMEYVPDARSITDHARAEGLSIPERLRLFTQVCAAVEHGHDKGIIHRDLKPANILVDRAGTVKIIDFGVARATDSDVAHTTIETEVGQILGTMQYMSPEQCAGDPALLDARSDVYALGVVLFELLCEERPYEIAGLSILEAIGRIHEQSPTRPSKTVRALRGDVETIVLKALEKEPGMRYASARALSLDIGRYLEGRPIEAKRRSIAYVARKAIGRRPVLSTLAALVLLLTGLAAVFGVESRQAGRDARVAEGERSIEQALNHVLSAQYEQVEPALREAVAGGAASGRVAVLRGLAALRGGNVERTIELLEPAFTENPESLGAWSLLLLAYLEAGEFEKAVELPELGDAAPRWPEDRLAAGLALHAYWPEQSLRWTEELAEEYPTAAVFYILGLHRVSILQETHDLADIEPALTATATARSQMPGNVRAIWNHAAARMVAADLHDLRGNGSLHEHYLALVEEDVALMLAEHGDTGDAHVAAAQLAMYQERWEDALAHLREAVQRPQLWPVARFYAPQLCYRLGRFEEGIGELEAMPERFHFHPIWCRERAFLLAETEGVESAEAYLQSWLELWRERHGVPANPVIRDVPFQVYCLLGKRADAVAYGREHLEGSAPLSFGRHYAGEKDRFLCGRIPAASLLAAAINRNERIDARYLIALEQIAGGNRGEAIEQLDAIGEEGFFLCDSRTLIPATWPGLLRQRLRDDPRWPPWIR